MRRVAVLPSIALPALLAAAIWPTSSASAHDSRPSAKPADTRLVSIGTMPRPPTPSDNWLAYMGQSIPTLTPKAIITAPDIEPPPPPPPPKPVYARPRVNPIPSSSPNYSAPGPSYYASGGCSPSFSYALDATTLNTGDWGCIRAGEGWGTYNNYGLLCWPCGVPDAYGYSADGAPSSVVAEVVLSLFARNGDHFSGTWNNRWTGGHPLW